MEYYELISTIYLLNNICFNKTNEVIGRVINKAMLMDKELAEKHERNEYKFYVYNSLYPIEIDKTYKKGRVYIFRIRTLEKSFAMKMKDYLTKAENEYFKIISIETKKVCRRNIIELYTMTPVLITVNNKYWLPHDDFMLLQKRVQANLEKKYNKFYQEKLNINHSFIQYIELLNRIPMSFFYKNTKLLANKFKIVPNQDDESQRLAFIAEAAGIGEKNSSVGFGFCNAQYLK